MDKTVEINEVVTFIKATREEAVALAYDIGGGEVHALHIQRGIGMPAETPVGYLVVPLKREWVWLTEVDIYELMDFDNYEDQFDFAYAIEAKLKEKNHD